MRHFILYQTSEEKQKNLISSYREIDVIKLHQVATTRHLNLNRLFADAFAKTNHFSKQNCHDNLCK